jgi:hypothetical protein
MVLMAIAWIVARPTEENASRSRSADADITPTATAPRTARTVRVADPEALEPAAETANPKTPSPVRIQGPGPSSVFDSVDLSDRASTVLVEPDDNPPLPPGHIAPDLVTLPSANPFIGYNIEGRKYLHFENSILNLSLVPLEVHGTPNPRTNITEVKQRIYAEDGTYVDRPIGSFFYHPDHEHWHIDAIAEYQIWSVDSEGLIGEPVVAARKASYCLRDDAHFSAIRIRRAGRTTRSTDDARRSFRGFRRAGWISTPPTRRDRTWISRACPTALTRWSAGLIRVVCFTSQMSKTT